MIEHYVVLVLGPDFTVALVIALFILLIIKVVIICGRS